MTVDFIDNGGGIPARSRGVIFEKFARLTDHASAGSAGLGLAICREVIGRLGGNIDYLPGQQGAAFRVTLPRAQANAPSVAAQYVFSARQERKINFVGSITGQSFFAAKAVYVRGYVTSSCFAPQGRGPSGSASASARYVAVKGAGSGVDQIR